MRKNKLPKKEQYLQAWFMFLQGMSNRSIAEKLQVPKSTVKKFIRIGMIDELKYYRDLSRVQISDIDILINQLKRRLKSKNNVL